MSATDELRRLLDERGTEHTDLGGMTEWTNECGRICRAYTRPEPLTVDIAMLAVPPEQAIAATLGGGKLTAEQVEKVIMSSDYWERANNHPALREGVWQAIADELNAELESRAVDTDDALNFLDEMREAGRISYDDYSQLFDVIAELGGELKPDGLPVGLTISEDGELLNWCGENYVKQSTLGSGEITAEQVRETVEKHWHDLPDEYDMPEAIALPEYSYDWQAIADELNAELGGGECYLDETESYSNANEVIHLLECSECGHTCEHVNGSYPRCPHCGRKAVER